MKPQQQGWKATLLLLLLLCCVAVELGQVLADPSGATISGAVTQTSVNKTPSMRNDTRGTITTMILNSVQQDQHWKAYVGNVTGILSLDNANNYSIYSWDLTSVTGQVYASRFNNITWSGVTCASQGLQYTESVFHNMTSQTDNFSKTFNWTIHKGFNVGPNSIGASTCNSTVTYNGSGRLPPTTSSPFQEILLEDANNYLLYLSDISDNRVGYDNGTYDFQMIVAESDVKTTPTPYYFYVELR